jgi:hypothetical protein
MKNQLRKNQVLPTAVREKMGFKKKEFFKR